MVTIIKTRRRTIDGLFSVWTCYLFWFIPVFELRTAVTVNGTLATPSEMAP